MVKPSQYEVDPNGTDLIRELSAHIAGKTILITGVSPGGLGAYFVESICGLDQGPQLVILAGRNISKIQELQAKMKKINASVDSLALVLDLQNFASVREAAERVISETTHIDVLVNNAGIMAPPYSKTTNGFESTFQSNHLSHFLFTNLIMEKLIAAREPRIVVVSSDGYRLGHVRHNDYNFHDGESYDPWRAYGQSKSANHLFARELARRFGSKGVTAVAIHPGVILGSNLGSHLDDSSFSRLNDLDRQIGASQGWSGFDVINRDQGIATHVFASFSPDVKAFNGRYLEKLRQIPFPDEEIYPWALGELEQRKSWELSERLVAQKFHI